MSQICCPYCGSVQVKAMANQPKKYPRPTDPIALADWQKGYDCKKCGNDFVLQPKKALSFLAKLCGWIILGLIVLFLYSAFTNSSKDDVNTSEKSVSESAAQQKEEEEIITPTIENNPLDQEFSKEAEEAAHAYIPPVEEPQKSIKNSTDQNDTLSIKTTLREKE